MKRLEELGISKAPWVLVDSCTSHYGVASVSGYRTSDTRRIEDARLIAAAPELYEALRTACSVIDEVIAADDMHANCHNGTVFKLSVAKKNMLAALSNASGEEANHD